VKSIRVFASIVVFLVAAPFLHGQEKQAATNMPPAETASEIPLRLQVVLTEFDGTRRISSLPYSLNILGTGLRDRQSAHLRYGVRVPIFVGTTSNNSVTYQDVGTNIDCTAIRREDGTYRLDLAVERSSVSMPGSNGNETDWKPGDSRPSPQPLIRSFRDDFTVVMKSGQTVEGTSAVDPVTGHVLKIDVTLAALK
jgi:hypothetical protein